MKPFRHQLVCRLAGHAFIAMLALLAVACDRKTEKASVPVATGEWHEFEGSWNAVGTRRDIPLGDKRRGSVVDLSGSMLLTGSTSLGVGFRAEVVALVDTETGLVGRAVFTDDQGDQVFSSLEGEGTAEKNRITGKFLGGTGRYAGVIGSYEFSWQYVIEPEAGVIQGRAVGLKGRFSKGQPTRGGSTP